MELIIKFYHLLIRPKRIQRLKGFIKNSLKVYKEGILARKKVKETVRKRETKNSQEKPIILISICQDEKCPGNYKYNGAIKLMNVWVKLFRKQGFEAYVVSYDSSYLPWLIEHQSHISIEKVKELKKLGKPLKFITVGLEAKSFIDLADEIYFFDAELSWTFEHLKILKNLLRKKKIRNIGTHSRTQQAWYMEKFGIIPIFIREWSDKDYWQEAPEKRETGLIGYMQEGPDSQIEVDEIQDICQKAGLDLKFIEVKGDEKEVLETMQRCDFYLGLNPGKNILWGEGCPRSQQEAMHSGCVVLAYDVFGNREYLIDGYTGFLALSHRADILAGYLIDLMKNPEEKEKIRKNSLEFINNVFTSKNRFSLIKQFLDLELETEKELINGLLNRQNFAKCFKIPAFLSDGEIRMLGQYSRKAETLVEIGSAYGCSSVVLLVNSSASAKIYSLDPFFKDSMSDWTASARECKRKVKRTLKILDKKEKIKNWTLIEKPSYEAVKTWKESIDFIFIDGDHNYEAVKKDFEDWFPFMKPNGYILFHDSRRKPDAKEDEFRRGWPGPTRLVQEIKNRNDLELIDEISSLSVFNKK